METQIVDIVVANNQIRKLEAEVSRLRDALRTANRATLAAAQEADRANAALANRLLGTEEAKSKRGRSANAQSQAAD